MGQGGYSSPLLLVVPFMVVGSDCLLHSSLPRFIVETPRHTPTLPPSKSIPHHPFTPTPSRRAVVPLPALQLCSLGSENGVAHVS